MNIRLMNRFWSGVKSYLQRTAKSSNLRSFVGCLKLVKAKKQATESADKDKEPNRHRRTNAGIEMGSLTRRHLRNPPTARRRSTGSRSARRSRMISGGSRSVSAAAALGPADDATGALCWSRHQVSDLLSSSG